MYILYCISKPSSKLNMFQEFATIMLEGQSVDFGSTSDINVIKSTSGRDASTLAMCVEDGSG